MDELVGLFGAARMVVELIDQQLPTDSDANDALAAVGHRASRRARSPMSERA
jgi:hypothetical protein